MKATTRILLATALVAGLGFGAARIAWAAPPQSGEVQAAINAGSVGEQADGYLGVKGSVSADVRAAVDAINIKRRAAYTDLAAKRGVTVQDVAASVGCTTLKNRVADGQAYRLPDGVWRTKSGAIDLPAYCA